MPKTKSKSFSNYVKDLTGQKFSRLTVIEFSRIAGGEANWKCKCSCGAISFVRGTDLRSGSTKSCGCFRLEILRRKGKNFKHGHTIGGLSPEYKAWVNLVYRCGNPQHPSFKYYGGRGITVCDRWLGSFPSFLADMGTRPGPKYSIDRIDNDGGYCKENCRWATKKEQCLNRRGSLTVEQREEWKPCVNCGKKVFRKRPDGSFLGASTWLRRSFCNRDCVVYRRS